MRLPFLLVALLPAALVAQTPSETLPLSGVLRDAGGMPATGPVEMTFRIYDQAVGGTSLWMETQAGIALVSGRYRVELGATNPLSPALFDSPDRWLGIEVVGDGEMAPRLSLSPTPTAHNALTLEGNPASEFARVLDLNDGTPASTPVGWDDLAGIPAGFLDRVDDDTTYAAGTGLLLTMSVFDVDFAGSGVATTVARSDHDHDPLYARRADLMDGSPATTPVGWGDLSGVPAGFLDGVDDDTTYGAGTGLLLGGTTFSVDFAGTGTATTAARSDHDHPLLETRITDLEADVMTLQALGGGVGANSELSFPDGVTNAEPMTLTGLQSSPYTVPAGKNFYVTSYYSQSTGWDLRIAGITVVSGLSAYGASTQAQHLEQPLVAGAGEVISSASSSVSVNGFLVDAAVTPVTLTGLQSTPFTVPAGQTLVITAYYSQSTGWDLRVSGTTVVSGLSGYGASTQTQRLGLPLLAAAGETVSSASSSVAINGYLRPATFAGTGGTRSGSADPALGALGDYTRSLLVTSTQAVPAGKVWCIDSVAPSTSLQPSFPSSSIRTQSAVVTINGSSVIAHAVWAIETSGVAGADGAGIAGHPLLDLPFYLPEGTTLAAGAGTAFLAVSEFDARTMGGQVLLVTSSSTVPMGKAWSLRGAAHDTALTPPFPSSSIRTQTGEVDIGGTTIVVRAVRAIETSGVAGGDGAGIHADTMLRLPLVLPEGTTLAPGSGTTLLSVIEFTP